MAQVRAARGSGTAPAPCKPANYGAAQTYEISSLRQAAACDLRQRRMSERTGQGFTAVSQTSIGSRYAREVDFFRWSVDGILMECRNQRQTVALSCTIDDFHGRYSPRGGRGDRYFDADDNGKCREQHAAAAN